MYRHEDSNRKQAIVVLVSLLVIGSIVFGLFVSWQNVDGSERVVWQKWSGISQNIGEDGIHFYIPASTTPHLYYIGSRRFVIDDQTLNPKNDYITKEQLQENQPDMEPLTVPVMMDRITSADVKAGKTTGPTNVVLRCSMQYHLNPAFLVKLHCEKTKNYEQNFVADVLREAIISNTTILDARTVYQGQGRVDLQRAIEKEIKGEERFEQYGIIVEKFIIRAIDLEDKEFLSKIKAEALAEQERKTAEKEKVAYEAKAQAERSKALAEQNRRLVEADTKKNEEIARAEAEKEKSILGAQAEAEKTKLAAEANKERARLEGEGIKLKKVAEAEGVLALGKAEAEASKLKLQAYQGEGGQRFAEVEKAKAFGQAIQHIQYIPSDMKIMSIGRDFMESLKSALPQHEAVK